MIGLFEFIRSLKMPVASVIIPTFGEARFSRWAIGSVRGQTVKNIEIFIICDGSPPGMVEFFEDIAKKDHRINVLSFEKSERTGEPYRDIVIRKEARGKNIFYCSHDDIWLPHHVEELERLLRRKVFVHSIHASVSAKERPDHEEAILENVLYADIGQPSFRERMLNASAKENFFGLTYAAHTKRAYLELEEGWATTPPGIWTDLHMWRKFLRKFPSDCATYKKITALNFPVYARKGWLEQEREAELEYYCQKIRYHGFAQELNRIANLANPLTRPFLRRACPPVRAGIIKVIIRMVRSASVKRRSKV